jgi:hypothetical protein
MNSNRRVLIFADWDNTFYSAKTFNLKLDWLKLRDYLASYQEGHELIEMVLYIGLPPDRERFQEVRLKITIKIITRSAPPLYSIKAEDFRNHDHNQWKTDCYRSPGISSSQTTDRRSSAATTAASKILC